jgi:gas vesicle protein
MIRILTVAAVAALIAAPASAQSVRVSTNGKSSEQVHAEITKAAKKVCSIATVGASFPREMYASCYKATIQHAVAQANDPALASVAGVKMAVN